MIAEAESQGATSEQLDVLSEARKRLDGISYADYETAVRLSIDCIQKAGYLIDGPETKVRWGLTVLEYGYGTAQQLTEAEDRAMNDAVTGCEQKYSSYIDVAYRSQPSMLAQQDAVIKKFTPALVACVRKYGLEIPDRPTTQQRDEALRTLLERKPNHEGPDCMVESGMGGALSVGEGDA